jgi:hypothetical protein
MSSGPWGVGEAGGGADVCGGLVGELKEELRDEEWCWAGSRERLAEQATFAAAVRGRVDLTTGHSQDGNSLILAGGGSGGEDLQRSGLVDETGFFSRSIEASSHNTDKQKRGGQQPRCNP